MSKVTCGYCGDVFAEDLGQPTCASCPVKGGCRFVRCPKCGYENPCEPDWVAKLRRWLRSDDARAAGYAQPDANERDARSAASVR